MIRVTVVSFSGSTQAKEKIYDHFKEKIPKPFLKKTQGSLDLPLLPDSAELHEVLELCNNEELGISAVFSDVYYTKKELGLCQFFQLRLPDPLELEGADTKRFGTIYEGSCPNCGFGGILRGDVLVDRKFMKRYKMGVLVPEVYVSESLKNAIERNNLSGISFERRVVDFKGREMPEFYVAKISNILPPMSNTTWLRDSWQQKCGHSIVYLRSDIQYEQEKLTFAEDFNLSVEHVDNDMMQALVISAKAKKVLQENDVFCRYVPVAIV